jgi:hypothetical protein
MSAAPKLRIAPGPAPAAEPAAPPSAYAKPTDPITTWLDTLSLFLKLPARDRANIRDELAGHLKERVRDLILSGTQEAQAPHLAIAELGDAVKLAHKLRTASRSPARRIVMNLTVFAVAGAALITSFVALRGGGAEHPSPAMMPQPAARAPEQIEHIKLTLGPGATWGDLMKQLSDKAGMPAEIRWRALGEMGLTPKSALGIEMKDQPLPGAFKFIADETGQPNNDVDYRVIDGRLVVATTAFFDQQETVLVAYDLTHQAESRAANENCSTAEAAAAVTSQFREVIEHMVYPDGWQDNGGTFASTAGFGAKLFIKAPKRYHTQIQWVMDQLPKADQHAEIRLDRFDNSRRSIEADVAVPIVRDVPILDPQFKSPVPVEPAGADPIAIRAENRGKLDVFGAKSNLKADEIRIQQDKQADLQARLDSLQQQFAAKKAALSPDNHAAPIGPSRDQVQAELNAIQDEMLAIRAKLDAKKP